MIEPERMMRSTVHGDMVKERTDAEGNHEGWTEDNFVSNGERKWTDKQVRHIYLQTQEKGTAQAAGGHA